jgi:hypothetical protein
MNSSNNNPPAKPRTNKLFYIAYLFLIFLFVSEIINFYISYKGFLTKIPSLDIPKIISNKSEFTTTFFITSFITIIIAPILEEFAYRYSVNGKLKNPFLKLYSYVALVFGLVLATLPITRWFDYRTMNINIFRKFNYFKSLSLENYIYLVEFVVPVIIFLFIVLLIKILNLKLEPGMNKINNFINRYSIIFFSITSAIWIQLHFTTEVFKSSSWVDILFLVNLFLACYIFCLYSKVVSIKASIMIHIIHNTFIVLATLLFNFDSFKYIYSILLTGIILSTVFLLRKEMKKFKDGTLIEI